METVEQVTINTTEGTQPTPEQVIEEAHKAELARQQAEQTEGRPDWLPEKFESPEAMAKAYAELEKKQSSGKPAEKPKAIEQPTREQVVESGLDISALEAEWNETGALSEESYKLAAEAGYSRDIVDNYIEGRQAVVARETAQIYDSVGGSDNYNEMLQWASDNLGESEIEAFNQTINTNDMASIQLAVTGLKARFDNAQTSEPARQVDGGQPATSDTYESWAQVQADMRDPRYKSDSAFNQMVTDKLGRSKI